MASSTRPGQTAVTRKVVLLGAFVVIAAAVYSGGWMLAATVMRQRLSELLDGHNAAGAEVRCNDMDIRGYPFRIGLFCSSVTVDDRFNGVSASLGAFRSAAQVYAPSHFVWEMDGPAELRSALGFSFSAEWERLHSSVSAWFDGLSRSSLVTEGLKVDVTTVANGNTATIRSDHGEFHIRRNGEDLDAASLVTNTRILMPNATPLALPPVSASFDVTMLGKAALLDPVRDTTAAELYGSKGEIRRLVIDLGEGRVLTANGPLSIGDDGNLSGKLHLELEKVEGWKDALTVAFPESTNDFDNAAKVLTAVFGGKDSGSVELTLREGVVSVGIIPIGVLPAL